MCGRHTPLARWIRASASVARPAPTARAATSWPRQARTRRAPTRTRTRHARSSRTRSEQAARIVAREGENSDGRRPAGVDQQPRGSAGARAAGGDAAAAARRGAGARRRRRPRARRMTRPRPPRSSRTQRDGAARDAAREQAKTANGEDPSRSSTSALPPRASPTKGAAPTAPARPRRPPAGRRPPPRRRARGGHAAGDGQPHPGSRSTRRGRGGAADCRAARADQAERLRLRESQDGVEGGPARTHQPAPAARRETAARRACMPRARAAVAALGGPDARRRRGRARATC